MRKVVYSASFDSHAYPFHRMGERVEVVTKPKDLTESDSVLILWGGADVDPSFYGHPRSVTSYCGNYRDKEEFALVERAVEMGIPIIGVCRGAQLLCCFAGGFLIQDTTGHAISSGHQMRTIEGRSIFVNSYHHQMMAGYERLPHELIGWCDKPLSRHYVYKDDLVYPTPLGFKEPELVWFPEIRGLAAQWHPEAMDEECEATEYLMEVFNAKCSNEYA